MSKQMLIDATHAEETRVVVLENGRLEELDVDTSTKKQIKGNIYLAKVVRVEPSLQAAFVDYGGNKHGFLAFGEIHPDYYQIPVADREALKEQMAAEAAAAAEEKLAREAEEEAEAEQALIAEKACINTDNEPIAVQTEEVVEAERSSIQPTQEGTVSSDTIVQNDATLEQSVGQAETSGLADKDQTETTVSVESADTVNSAKDEESDDIANKGPQKREVEKEDVVPGHLDVETVSDAEVDDVIRHRSSFYRKYRIQEVIRQGQVMLVQVIKEERGNKGAALTTYLSLAGRYSVLMPNNGKGGGVSRKISNAKDRKALREMVDKLPIPQGMSVIIRTAGQGKTKTEIKRDYDYLIKTWMQIRDNTLESIAPKLIHEEGDIIKRSLRDVFTPDIDEVWVEGEKIFKSTRAFMKLLMPSQAKKIKQYKGEVPLFQEYQVESQLESIHSNIVQLRSGGYLVIDQTEALVAVDVNSGRATREHDIEETALRTNLETCDELARQLKLRDLAGLVVIDFIDMDEQRNNAAVERRLKEALKGDRARIQVGKISGFGLMEMSRQRLHSSFLESSYHVCPHCGGKGVVRSVESCAMRALRLLDEAAVKNKGCTLLLSLPLDVATYVLNFKRDSLKAIEERFQISIQVLADAGLPKMSDYRLERIRDNGERAAVQLVPSVQKRGDKNSDKAQAIDAIVQQAVALEEEGSSSRHGRRWSRNQRRREWKRKQKQLAAEQAAKNEKYVGFDQNEVKELEAGSMDLSDKQDGFTVVEQVSLNEMESQRDNETSVVADPSGENKKKSKKNTWKQRIKEKHAHQKETSGKGDDEKNSVSTEASVSNDAETMVQKDVFFVDKSGSVQAPDSKKESIINREKESIENKKQTSHQKQNDKSEEGFLGKGNVRKKSRRPFRKNQLAKRSDESSPLPIVKDNPLPAVMEKKEIAKVEGSKALVKKQSVKGKKVSGRTSKKGTKDVIEAEQSHVHGEDVKKEKTSAESPSKRNESIPQKHAESSVKEANIPHEQVKKDSSGLSDTPEENKETAKRGGWWNRLIH